MTELLCYTPFASSRISSGKVQKVQWEIVRLLYHFLHTVRTREGWRSHARLQYFACCSVTFRPFPHSHCSRKLSQVSGLGLWVALCERVKNPDIEKCTLPPLPKTERTDIQASFIKAVAWHCWLKLFPWKSESKVWLNLNIMAYVLENGCEQVSHFVMPPMDKSAFHTRHCMIDVESLAMQGQIDGRFFGVQRS